jgi:ligand-binding sensor domain-containing protein
MIAYAVLLFYLNYSNGQIEKNNYNYEGNKSDSTTKFNSLNTTINAIDKNIRSVFQDRNGNYWFGTNGSGVYLYKEKTVTQFTVNDGLSDNQINTIQEDELGNIWFGTGVFGISKFDGTKFTVYSNKVKLTEGTEIDWKSKKNDLWFYAGGGVFRYSNSSIDYLPFEPSSLTAQINPPFSLSRYSVYCILKDKKGTIWFGTQAEGVCRFDGKTITWFKDKGLAGPAVLGLFEDSKGNLWFGNNGAGLFLYDGNTLTNFTAEKGLDNAGFRVSEIPGSATMTRVYSINEDVIGNIWIGTIDAGVWKYDGTKLTNYTIKDGLTSNAINTIYKDNYGELWFGTDENGICKFNGTTFTEFIIK